MSWARLEIHPCEQITVTRVGSERPKTRFRVHLRQVRITLGQSRVEKLEHLIRLSEGSMVDSKGRPAKQNVNGRPDRQISIAKAWSTISRKYPLGRALKEMVPRVGFEPTRPCGQRILSPSEVILPDLTKRDEPIHTGCAAVKVMLRPAMPRDRLSSS